jgi:hypothetical protein
MADFVSTVPTNFHENLAYRLELREKCKRDAGMRRAVRSACAEDILYFLSALAWLYEPRIRYGKDGYRLPKIIPFIPWPHQYDPIRQIRKNLGICDVVVEKCRDEGFSWIMCMMAIHDWLFNDFAKVGLVSSTEKKSDDPGNMGSMGAKIDWELTKLPRWMVGKLGKTREAGDYYRNLGDHSFVNNRNLAQINLFAAGGDTGRGDRFLWFGLDEHAADEWKKESKDRRVMDSTQSATNSRLLVSTPNGTDGAYYDAVHTPTNRILIQVDWRNNPTKNRGLYRMVKNVPVAVDPVNNPLPPHYNPPSKETLDKFSRLTRKGFLLDKVERSPWYDDECDRAGSTPQSIAKEQDRDYGGSMYRVYGPDFMSIAEATAKLPVSRGSLILDADLDCHFDQDPKGPVLLWCNLGPDGAPPKRPYVIGCDIGSGQGGSYTSNSVITVIDAITREQVLEFASNVVRPDKFADYAIAIAYWFHGAYLAWEDMGPGIAFKSQVLNREYHHLYYRETQYGAGTKKQKKLGYHNQGDQRTALFWEMHNAVCVSDLVIRSKDLLREYPQYVVEKGEIQFVGHKNATDDAFGKAHGDRVIAMGVAFQALKDRPQPRAKDKLPEIDPHEIPPEGTMARRRWEARIAKQAKDVWDVRKSSDLKKRRMEDSDLGVIR